MRKVFQIFPKKMSKRKIWINIFFLSEIFILFYILDRKGVKVMLLGPKQQKNPLLK